MPDSFLQNQALPSTQPRSIVIGTAGHIDHGKTALIRALTGVDTDRLPEEKKRGITIDLGFASLDLERPDRQPLRVSFIDVPGHARFVRNMLAGAGGIDAVLLVISVEEGVKPQTEEHLAICSLLGIRRGITVLSKSDAVDPSRRSAIRSSVETFLSTTFLASEPIIEASAFTGAGLDTLRQELALLAERTSPRESDYLARLPIDRAFSMKGFGTVITGTLLTGTIAASTELAIEPGSRRTRVRGIQVHGRAASSAMAATRVALNLGRVEAAELRRGDTLVDPSTLAAVHQIDVELQLLPNAPALKHRARVHFHAFASECMATVSLYGYQPVGPNDRGLARLRLASPIVLLPGDRFVLRQGAPITTVGGGIVLDAHPVQRVKKAKARQWLQLVLDASAEKDLALRVARRGAAGISIAELSTETGLRPVAIRTRLEAEMQLGEVVALENNLLLARDGLREAATLVDLELKSLFKEPGAAGVKRAVLKSRLRLRAEVVDSVLGEFERQEKFRVVGEQLLPPNADRAALSLEQQRTDSVERAYRQAGLAPPTPAALASDLAIDAGEMRRLITILLREKKLVRLGDDSLCVHQEALTELKQRFQSLRGQTIDIAQFKELTGVSRKYAVPLLEYLDHERVTRRQSDLRLVL